MGMNPSEATSAVMSTGLSRSSAASTGEVQDCAPHPSAGGTHGGDETGEEGHERRSEH